MSKEHKMTYDGKKYVTKRVNDISCKGCVFLGDHYVCTLENTHAKRICSSNLFKDQYIWVEDKSIDNKPKKRHKYIKKYETRIIDGFPCKTLLKNAPKEKNHYWIIEDYIDGEWMLWAAKETRSQARDCLYELTEDRPKRIRKFVAK
jgi:hypothetical protein